MSDWSDNYPELAQAWDEWGMQPEPQVLQGKTILITGAGAGIGEALAKTCALFGANVVLLGRTRRHLETVFDWIEANTNTQPVIVPCDLAALNDEAIDALHGAISSTYGGLHGLVHCASVLGQLTPTHMYPMDEWQQVFAVNVHAVQRLNQGLYDLLDAQEKSCVIHVSSSVGREGRAYWGAYSASKFAVEGMSQTFADENESAGRLFVYSINPGATRTKMRRQAFPGEDPNSVPTPEARIDVFLYLLSCVLGGGKTLPPTGSQWDARAWQPS